MTRADTTCSVFRMLARLPEVVPSAAQEDRVRARCHAALARCQRRHRGLGYRVPVVPVLRAALALAVCVYLSEAVREAWRLSHWP
jgi:hypothetical protein